MSNILNFKDLFDCSHIFTQLVLNIIALTFFYYSSTLLPTQASTKQTND